MPPLTTLEALVAATLVYHRTTPGPLVVPFQSINTVDQWEHIRSTLCTYYPRLAHIWGLTSQDSHDWISGFPASIRDTHTSLYPLSLLSIGVSECQTSPNGAELCPISTLSIFTKIGSKAVPFTSLLILTTRPQLNTPFQQQTHTYTPLFSATALGSLPSPFFTVFRLIYPDSVAYTNSNLLTSFRTFIWSNLSGHSPTDPDQDHDEDEDHNEDHNEDE